MTTETTSKEFIKKAAAELISGHSISLGTGVNVPSGWHSTSLKSIFVCKYSNVNLRKTVKLQLE